MKKFTIKETRPAIYTWTYEVEAEDANQALEIVFNQQANIVDTDVELDYEADGEYNVEELN